MTIPVNLPGAGHLPVKNLMAFTQLL